MNISIIITAAGSGSRFGGSTPKQLSLINGLPMLIHSIIPFLDIATSQVPSISDQLTIQAIIVTTSQEHQDQIQSLIKTHITDQLNPNKIPINVVTGGHTRQISVKNAVDNCPDDHTSSIPTSGVLIHDGARPFITTAVIKRVLSLVQENPQENLAVIPVIDVTDTIKQVNDNTVQSHLDRSQLAAVQTPQYFELKVLKKAYERVDITDNSLSITDESMLMESLNIPVKTVTGDPENIKVTYPSDLEFSS